MEAIFLDCGAGAPQLKRNPLDSRSPMTSAPSPRRSAWRSIALWQITGIGFATIALAAAHVTQLATTSPSLPIAAWPWAFATAGFWILIPGFFLLPLSLTAMFLWTRLAHRWGAVEGNYLRLAAGLLVLSFVLALLVGAISSWETVFGEVDEPFVSSTAAIARDCLPGILLGLIVPRFVIPSLRPGAFLPQSRAVNGPGDR